MSLVTQMLVAEKYGLRLDVPALAAVTGMKPGSIHNAISAATFPIATYVDGGKRWASYQEVARHLDDCALKAS